MNVLDFAMDVERSGIHFYRQMASRTGQDGPRTIFQMVAEDEQKILDRLKEMKRELGPIGREDSGVLDRLSNPFRSPALAKDALALKTDIEAYAYVIGLEEGLCRLFEQASEHETDPAVRDLLKQVALEERRELESLSTIRDFVGAPAEFLAWGEFSNQGEFHNFGRDEG